MALNKGVVGTFCAGYQQTGFYPGITLIDETYLRKAGEPRFFIRGEKYGRFQYHQAGPVGGTERVAGRAVL